MEKLMILGAGIYQVPLIKTARKMGIHTIAVSIPGNYPGFQFADEVNYTNTVDYEAITTLAKEKRIDGIVTAGTDVAVITIGKVCDTLGLKGLSFEAAQIAANKELMKEAYVREGVRTARFCKVSFDENVLNKVSDFTYPMIVKAIDSSGSRGITRINSAEDFPEAVAAAKAVTRKDYYIVEEFITGSEFGAQAFVCDGQLQFVLPHGDYVFQGDTGVPVGHYAPFALSPEQEQDVFEQTEKAVRAMKLDNCAVNADFIMRDGKTYVLELGGRSGATCLAELVSLYYGYDYYEKIIETALGGAPQFPTGQRNPNAAKLLMSDRDGVIRSITNDNSPDNPDIYQIQFDYGVGDSVRKFHVGPDRIGHVIAKGKTLDEAVRTLDEAIGKIHIEVG